MTRSVQIIICTDAHLRLLPASQGFSYMIPVSAGAQVDERHEHVSLLALLVYQVSGQGTHPPVLRPASFPPLVTEHRGLRLYLCATSSSLPSLTSHQTRRQSHHTSANTAHRPLSPRTMGRGLRVNVHWRRLRPGRCRSSVTSSLCMPQLPGFLVFYLERHQLSPQLECCALLCRIFAKIPD